QLQLVLRTQTVPALDLRGGRPGPEHRLEPATRQLDQLVLAPRPRVPYGRMDAPAPPRDLHVRHAARPQRVLVGAPAPENGMGVRVHEAGRDHATATVHAPGIGKPTLELGLGGD